MNSTLTDPTTCKCEACAASRTQKAIDNIQYAINRLDHSQKYGPDMASSAALCISDALSLMNEAIALLNE